MISPLGVQPRISILSSPNLVKIRPSIDHRLTFCLPNWFMKVWFFHPAFQGHHESADSYASNIGLERQSTSSRPHFLSLTPHSFDWGSLLACSWWQAASTLFNIMNAHGDILVRRVQRCKYTARFKRLHQTSRVNPLENYEQHSNPHSMTQQAFFGTFESKFIHDLGSFFWMFFNMGVVE